MKRKILLLTGTILLIFAIQPNGWGMKVICLGDSITGQPNLKRYLKWSSILECMLEAHQGENKVSVLNRGIGGDTTGGALKRLQGDVLNEKPDIVIILLGGNDARIGIDRQKVKENLLAIVRQCKLIKAEVLLLQYHVIPDPENPAEAWVNLTANNDLIAEIGATEKIPVLDMKAPMEEAFRHHKTSELAGRTDGVAVWKETALSQEHLVNVKDGVHLNPGGELIFARTVFKKLQNLKWIK